MVSPRLYRGLRFVLVVIVSLGVVLALGRILRRWNGNDVHVHALPFVLSIVALLVANFFQALGWMYLLERMAGHAVAIRPLISVFMSGQLARYTPGKIGLPVVRIAGARRLGLSARLIAASVGIEVTAWIGVGVFFACGSLLCNWSAARPILGLSRNWIWLVLLATSSSIVVALLFDRNRFPSWLLELLHAEGKGPFVSCRMIGMQLLAWSGWWLLGFLSTLAVGGSIGDGLAQAPIFILAPIIGFLALVAPGGIGVRETIISYALAPQIGASAAVSAAVLARAAALASELGGWLIAVIWERRCQR